MRTLAVDLGRALGVESHMSFLQRSASAGLTLETAYTLGEIADMVSKQEMSFCYRSSMALLIFLKWLLMILN